MIHTTKNIIIRQSNIHGVGIFSVRAIAHGTYIITDQLGHKFGGYNHSCKPNVILRQTHNIIDAITIRDILPREELTVTYSKQYIPFPCNCEICRK